MFARTELENTIKDLESNAKSFSDCEKLSALYTVYDHHFAPKEQKESRAVYTETVIDDYGDSEFFETIRDREAESVWGVMDELMITLQLLYPKLYHSTLREIDSL